MPTITSKVLAKQAYPRDISMSVRTDISAQIVLTLIPQRRLISKPY